MKKNLFVLTVILFSGLLIGCSSKTYNIDLPDKSDIESITVLNDGILKDISENEFETIFDILKNKETKEDSIQDGPVGVSNYITLTLHTESKKYTVYVYEKGSKYYIEQPYNGIYKISSDEYDILKQV